MHQLISILSLAFLLAACDSSSKTEPDTDGDGIVDSQDAFPQDAKESKDTDGDGVGDNADVFPEDASETLDADSDKVGDNSDNCPQTANSDQTNTDANFENGDALGDACDADDDADDTLDAIDAFPQDPTETIDEDDDKIGDNKDLDLTSSNKQVENSISLTRLIETGRATRFIGPQAYVLNNVYTAQNQVANAGDVNKDGFDDMLVSIPGYKQDPAEAYLTGIVYLFFGGQTPWPQTIDLNNISEDVPHVIFEKQSADDSDTRLGFRLAALGDVNGDTIDDFAISATKANSSSYDNAGAVHIVYGRSSWLTDAGDDHTISYANLKADYALSFYGDKADDEFGSSVSNVGDINSDGLVDIAMGQYRFDTDTVSHAGRIYILFGGTQFTKPTSAANAAMDIEDVLDSQRMRITGSVSASVLGENILPLGNFDNDADNTDDFLVMVGLGDGYQVILGQKNPPANIEADSLITDHGFLIESSGTDSKVAVGNLLADDSNTQDILLVKNSGTYIIKGGVGDWPATLDPENFAVEHGIEVPFNAISRSTTFLAMLPDSNQDGLDEPLISSLYTNDDIGRVQKMFEDDWSVQIFTPDTVNNSIQNIMNDSGTLSAFGSLAVLGDMDNDGQVEFVLNSIYTDTPNGTNSGDFYIVKGFAQVYPE